MTAWWRWSGNVKGREGWDNLKPHGEGRWKNNPGGRDGPAGWKSGTQRKIGLVSERKLHPYAPNGVERTNFDEQHNAFNRHVSDTTLSIVSTLYNEY